MKSIFDALNGCDTALNYFVFSVFDCLSVLKFKAPFDLLILLFVIVINLTLYYIHKHNDTEKQRGKNQIIC